MWSQVSLFQQISTLEPNFSMKISNFQIQISIIWSTTNNLSKTLICIKIVQQMAEILFKKGWKSAKLQINHGFLTVFLNRFLLETHVFQPCFDVISAICWPILIQNGVLERLLVEQYMTEIWISNSENFLIKLGSKVEICWKSGTFDHISLNNFEELSIFLRHIYIFWKLRKSTDRNF